MTFFFAQKSEQNFFRIFQETIPSDSDYHLVLKSLLFDNPRSAIFESILTYAGDKEVQRVTAFQDAIASQLAFGLGKDSELRAAIDYQV